MIVRRFTPRQAGRLLFSHTSRPWTRRIAIESDAEAASVYQNESDPLGGSHTEDIDPASRQIQQRGQPHQTGAQSDLAVQEFYTRNHIRHTTGHYGSVVAPHYQPMDLIANPPSPSDLTLELLLASQTHLGHSTSLWNPSNARYIFGVREGIHIISLDTTAVYLRRAARVITSVAKRGGVILFAGTRRGHERCITRAAELAGACHLFERWNPGSITNGQQILGRCQMKVVDEQDREVPGFEEQLLERAVLKPDLVICLNPVENYIMLHECGLAGVPTIGIIDTDANPTWVTYPIPANDDSIRSVAVIAGILGRAGQEGLHSRLALAQDGEILYPPPAGLTTPKVEDRKERGQSMTAEAEDLEDEADVAGSADAAEEERLDAATEKRSGQSATDEKTDDRSSTREADAAVLEQDSGTADRARRKLDKEDKAMQQGSSHA